MAENSDDKKLIEKLGNLRNHHEKSVDEKHPNFWVLQRQSIMEKVEKRSLLERLGIVQILKPATLKVAVPVTLSVIILITFLMVPYMQKPMMTTSPDEVLEDFYASAESAPYLVKNMDQEGIDQLNESLLGDIEITGDAVEVYEKAANDNGLFVEIDTMNEEELNYLISQLKQMG
jgi:hypothetical protein